jgi:hypothetical protein
MYLRVCVCDGVSGDGKSLAPLCAFDCGGEGAWVPVKGAAEVELALDDGVGLLQCLLHVAPLHVVVEHGRRLEEAARLDP